MSPAQFLSEARELDKDIRFLDALLHIALASHAHPKIAAHIAARRNDTVKRWGAVWQTRKVEP